MKNPEIKNEEIKNIGKKNRLSGDIQRMALIQAAAKIGLRLGGSNEEMKTFGKRKTTHWRRPKVCADSNVGYHCMNPGSRRWWQYFKSGPKLKARFTSIVWVFALIALAANCNSQEKTRILWRPDSIFYAIEKDDQYLKIGQYLQLNQKLKSGESGWAESRIDLPDSWSIPFVKFNQVGELLLQTKEGTTYFLSPINFGQIRFEILDKGKKTEGELISIWNKLAKKEKNSRITIDSTR